MAINGRPVDRWEEVLRAIAFHPEREKVLTVERSGRELTVRVKPRMEEDGKGRIGISPVVVPERLSPAGAVWAGAKYTYRITVVIADFLGKMLTGRAPADVGGPVRVMVEIGKAAHFGFLPLVQLTAFLSINLGFFNLLPVPALDGARVVFLTWESVTRRPLDPEKENIIHMVGFAFLLLLMVLVTYRDFIHLASGVN
uniref:Peptidase M50 domain-containing protein n=1 Tax=Ammonifex degensii TaxID=42838 RepID=A0A7C1F3E5_9THEO